jgi:hypothetical protein
MPSGERMNAMWPSRGGRLIVTPASISRWQVRRCLDLVGEVAEVAAAGSFSGIPVVGQLDLGILRIRPARRGTPA